MQKYYLSIILILGTTAILLVSCTKPIEPGSANQPDMVKSYVRAIVSIPEYE